MTNRFNLWGLALLALSGTAIGCADHVKSAVVTCPCDRGICCASGVCADDETACGAATQALSSASAGRWTGYIENFTFASGSDALDLTLHVEDDGSLAGELIMGQGPAPAPPTDPNVGWPVGVEQPGFWQPNPVEGLAYHLTNVRWTALRLQFDLNLSEPWGPWCEMQTSYDIREVGGVTYENPWRCTPEDGWVGSGEECFQRVSADPSVPKVAIDCNKAALCGHEQPCHCTADGCAVATKPSASFDIALRGNDGDGSETALDESHNVRLIRASH